MPPPSPWLEPPGGLPAYANHAEVSLYTRQLGNGVYCVDVPRDVFASTMERASRHPGYSASQRQFKSYHVRDLVLEKSDRDVRVVRKRPLSWHELPGAPLYAVMYEHLKAPFSAFSCGAELHDERHVSRLSLRVHKRAKLVFEVYTNAAGRTVRRVYITISLDPAGLAADMPDLRRTVENTVHAVIMGVRPKRKPRPSHWPVVGSVTLSSR